MTAFLKPVLSAYNAEESAPTFGSDFRIRVPSGKVASNLIDFPLLIDLVDMPAGFWTSVTRGGLNLRAYKANGKTRLPLDVIVCDKTQSKGTIAVKTDLLSGSNNDIIIRCTDSVKQVYWKGKYGTNAVWSDYKAVMAGGSSAQNRSGVSKVAALGRPSGFTLASTSPTVIGHEGVITDGSTFVIVGSNALRKYNSALTTVTDSELDPAGILGLTDCGGGCYFEGKIYVVLYDPGTAFKIGIFDYATLDYISSFDIYANADGAGGCAINPNNRLLYTIVYDADAPYQTKMHKYNIDTGAYAGAVTLSEEVRAAQGIIYYHGGFYVPLAAADRYARITTGGVVTLYGEFGVTGTIIQDGDSFEDSIYTFSTTGSEVGVVHKWTPQILDMACGMDFPSALGRIVTPINPTTVWTLRAMGRRSTGATLVIACLHPGGTGNANEVYMGYSSSLLRIGVDGVNGFLNLSPGRSLGTSTDFMGHLIYNGTTARHGFYNGANKVTQSGITAFGSGLPYVIFGSEKEGNNDNGWRGRLGLCYLRDGVLSDDWIAAEWGNFSDSAFYSVTAL